MGFTTSFVMLLVLVMAVCLSVVNTMPVEEEEKVKYELRKYDDFGLSEDAPTVPEIIRKNGYPCEIHTVTTKDGYILTMHRIPKDRSRWWPLGTNPTPVFLQHGLLSSSASWVLDSPDKAAAFVFYDHGYDVWMGNVRGNKYSRKHVSHDPDCYTFWQFSWDEMAEHDLPEMIDYVLHITEYEQLYYIGHSMGTTIFFAGLSLKPEYNEKIKMAFALAPVGTVGHIETPFKYLSYGSWFFDHILSAFGAYEFLPENEVIIKYVLRPICDDYHFTRYICSNFLFFIAGFDNHEFNTTLFPVITSELLSGTSIYTVIHYAQEYRSGTFQKYDHGWIGNIETYGHLSPPSYNMSKVTAPVVLFYGENDYLADPQDVQFLYKNLPNVKLWKVDYPDFNHLDFLWAIDVYRLVYKRILNVMGHF